ncbi:MAG: hypothetical protein LUQ65_14280, partial [Candidatus Helarchaeota archaeon]|nr:hypothetical protein [Candidatus Helarchaeota archaeon]
MDEDRLYSLSVEALNEVFNVLQAKSIEKDKLKEIISNNSSSQAIIEAIKNYNPPPASSDSSIESGSSLNPASETFLSQDSVKADIIPVIQSKMEIDSEKLFSLSIDVLNQIFGLLESGVITANEIKAIILESTDSNEINSKLQSKMSAAPPSSDTYKDDLVTGILFNIPEANRAQIEPKLREINDMNELSNLSQMDFPELQAKLGLQPSSPQDFEGSSASSSEIYGRIPIGGSHAYDETADLRAGILAQIPPSLRGVIGDRLEEIKDMSILLKLSQMNYVQVQQELGLAAQTASDIPAEVINPVDTAAQRSAQPSPSASSPSSAALSSQATPQSQAAAAPSESSAPTPEAQAQIQQMRKENQKYIPFIQKMAEKVLKIKLTESGPGTPEEKAFKEKIAILERVHPSRVEKILSCLKEAKDKARFKALFDWYVYSKRFEDIETYVEHWQGNVQGQGGFRAAINVARFDPIVEHLPTREIEGINVQAQKALERIHSSDLNVRARGVEDIKQISNYLLQKAH